MRHNEKKLGVILAYVSQLISLVTGVVYTPVMLRLLGQSEYGLYQLVASVVSYLSLFSLGFSASYNRFYSPYAVKGDCDGISKLNGIFLLVFLSLAILCFGAGITLAQFSYEIFGNGLTSSELSKANILFVILVINMSIVILNTVFECFITAHEKFVFQKLLTLIRSIANPFICLPLLILGKGSVSIVIVSLMLTIMSFLVNVYYCFYKLCIKISFQNMDFTILRNMSKFTFYIFLNQIIDQINWSTDKFLLGRLVNTKAVAVYGVASTLNVQYISLSTAISNVFSPSINMIIANGNYMEKINNLFVKIGRVQYIVLTLILSGFIFVGKPFVKMWAGEEYSNSYYIALLLLIPVTIPLIQNIGIEVQRAMNKHQIRSVVYAFIAIANIIVSIYFIKVIGVIGAALGTAISLLVGNGAFMNWYYHRFLKINIFIFWDNIFQLSLSMVPAFIFGYLIMKYASIDGVVKLIIYSLIYSFVYFIFVYLGGLNNEEKKVIRKGIIKLLYCMRGARIEE